MLLDIYFSMNYIGYERYMIKSRRGKRNFGFIKKCFLFLFILSVLSSMLYLVVHNKSRIEKLFGLTNQLVGETFSVYLIKFYVGDDFDVAIEKSQEIMASGGAGILKKADDGSNVYISCYPEKSKAEKVNKRLSEDGYKCSIEQMNFDEYVLSESVSVSDYKECFSVYTDTFKSLYDIFEKYSDSDMKNIAKQKVLGVNSDFLRLYNKYKQIENSSSELCVYSLYLDELKNIINNLCESNDVIWSVRYSMVKLCFEYSKMNEAMGAIKR